MSKDVSLLPDDEELVYTKTDMLTNKKKKSNLGQLVKVMRNSEEHTQISKGSYENIVQVQSICACGGLCGSC